MSAEPALELVAAAPGDERDALARGCAVSRREEVEQVASAAPRPPGRLAKGTSVPS